MSRRGSVLEGVEFKGMDFGPHFEAMRISQQERQLEQQNKQNQQKQKEKSDKEAYDLIEGVKLAPIGDNTIDVMTDKQLTDLQGKLMDMQMKGAPLDQLRLTVQRELPPIAQGHTVAKNKFDQIKSGVTDLGKDYPTGDLSAARTLAAQEMIKDVVEFDEKGNPVRYKDASLIPEKNYISALTSDDKLGQWYKPSGALESHIKTLPTPTVGESKKVRDSRGREIDDIWTGQGSVFSEIRRDENGKAIGMEIKAEKVPIGKNEDGSVNEVLVLPKEEFDVLVGTPQAKADFILKFNQDLRSKNIDPSKIDPRAKDILQRQYARDYLDKTGIDGRSFIPKMADKQPLPPRVSVRVGDGKGGDETKIRDVFKEVKDKASTSRPGYGFPLNSLSATAQGVILKYANELTGGDLTQADIYVRKEEDGTISIVGTDNQLIAPMDFADINIKVQPGVPEKREVVERGKSQNNPAPTQNKWDKYKRN